MANLPRDKEFIYLMKQNGIDFFSIPPDITLQAFYAYMLTQSDRWEAAKTILDKYKENE